jgi:hypothetical protein
MMTAQMGLIFLCRALRPDNQGRRVLSIAAGAPSMLVQENVKGRGSSEYIVIFG